jgi:hypothetical protein
LQYGLVLWLVLLTWSPLLPRPTVDAQPTSVTFEKDARTVTQTDGTTTAKLGAMTSATGAPPALLASLEPGSNQGVGPTAEKLSPRLRLLADWATTGMLPTDAGEQDRLLGLAGAGAGSLSRDAAGNPIVDARVLDTTAETIAALTALPADVLSVAPEYGTVTLALAPERLVALASIAAVQYVGEVIRPERRSPGGLPGGGIVPGAP